MSARAVRAWLLASTVAIGLVLSACRTPPPAPTDSFVVGQQQAESGALLEALVRLDSVALAHDKYSEARNLSQAVERRLRKSQQLILLGLEMRREWRDDEAIDLFRQALTVWPGTPHAMQLIRATRQRLLALGKPEKGAVGETLAVTTSPREPSANQSDPPAAPITEVAPREPTPEKPDAKDVDKNRIVTPPQQTSSPGNKKLTPISKAARQRMKTLQAALVHVERYLQRGDLRKALDLLATLHSEQPDAKLGQMFARVLHQRALLRYGRGLIPGAVHDWRRVLELHPKHPQARAFLKSAQAELDGRSKSAK